jgi:signal transduction histidine kinase
VLLASTFADLARQLDRQLETDQMRKSDLVKLSSTLAEGGQILERNLERANVLLRNFRQVSADQASEQRRNFDLATVVAEVLSSMAPSLRKMPHKVIQSIPSGILMDSHPGPLGQVLINLINNACLHAFDDRSDGLVSISAAADDKQVVLVVEDNGRGIAPEALAHLFRPFYSTKVGQGGTGLGMTIVDNIVSKTLGGKVQVHSELGKGTRIEIVLPLTSPPVSS